jgi:antitoxin component of RelBE/YafQ-DinJ toxin-antitoxin module
MSTKKDVRLSIRIPAELREAALNKAKREDMTLSQVVRRFLRKWIDEDSLDLDQEDKQEEID